MSLHESIRKHISESLERSKVRGETTCVLVSGDIHREMELENRMPAVCSVMYQLMGSDDRVLSETQSKQSSTIRIKYHLN